jgi:hypothetical protein
LGAASATLGVLALTAALALPARGAEGPSDDPTQLLWQSHSDPIEGPQAARGLAARAPHARMRLRTFGLDHRGLAALLAAAPRERTRAARERPLVLALPAPDGGFQRFAVQLSPVMEPGLSAKHPEIRTYSGRGLDRPGTSVRFDVGPLGLHASVRSPEGMWYVDPASPRTTTAAARVYRTYFGRDLAAGARVAFAEAATAAAEVSTDRGYYNPPATVRLAGAGFTPSAPIVVGIAAPDDGAPSRTLDAVADGSGAFEITFAADPDGRLGTHLVEASDGDRSASAAYDVVTEDDTSVDPPVGDVLRTYRLALLSDPTYASYFGPENVTAAKVALVNRVTHIYEAETSIRLVLIAGNDALNLDTPAQMTGTNGPCGGAACFTALQAASCTGATLTRIRQVIGLLAGASSFDVGHMVMGTSTSGGTATLGVVGGNSKAQGCTAISTPVGDLFAVGYVAHELGHQFGANHTYNGTQGACATMRSAGNSIEPGSGSSIMSFGGACAADDLQARPDPYWSLRSFDEVTNYVAATTDGPVNEVLMVALTDFTMNGDSFRLRYQGRDSALIVRGTNFTTAGVRDAIASLGGWPPGGVTISGLADTGFMVTFGASVSGTDIEPLSVSVCNGCSGFVGEIAKGGPTTRGGTLSLTGNGIPTVTVPAPRAIPVRTPFALTGSAIDPDGDSLTYMWEQNDRGGPTGTPLLSNTKTNGPLFRQFGAASQATAEGSLVYGAPGVNVPLESPTRVFPDLAQILANNTNAETGTCPAGNVECFSEFLPTAAYVGVPGVNANPPSLHFRLTARDGRENGGAVNSATTTLVLAPAAGPFLVTAPNTPVTWAGASLQNVAWDVAGTTAEPVGAAEVTIRLSVDGGLTYPYLLAEATPNDGSEEVLLPNVGTTTARVKVEAVGNVFFDLSNADFAIEARPEVDSDVPSEGAVVAYSDSLAPAVHVTAADADSPGSALVAVASGLPAGLSLVPSSVSDDSTRPGTASWTLAGRVSAAPGTYEVTVVVSDDSGGTQSIALTIAVTPEDAEAVFTGDARAFTAPGSTAATVLLRATVRDSAVVAASGDAEPGHVAGATVTFKEAGATLCGPLPVALLEGTTTGTASCSVPLWPGLHRVDVEVGAYYRGATRATVEVREPSDSDVEADGGVVVAASAGVYKADHGTRLSFDVEARYDVEKHDGGHDDHDDDRPLGDGREHDDDDHGHGDKKASRLSGALEATFRSGGRAYQVKGSSLQALGVAWQAESGAPCDPRGRAACIARVSIRGTATLLDVTSARRPVVVAAGLSLELTLTAPEKDKDKDKDRRASIGVTLWNGPTLLVSSRWNGVQTVEQALADGKIKVR